MIEFFGDFKLKLEIKARGVLLAHHRLTQLSQIALQITLTILGINSVKPYPILSSTVSVLAG